jgi:hypothetical protein
MQPWRGDGKAPHTFHLGTLKLDVKQEYKTFKEIKTSLYFSSADSDSMLEMYKRCFSCLLQKEQMVSDNCAWI